ncbi:MAG: PadR family transcriptional regulator [Oscillospiraceae bacterium]|nr:PadR family transcriptional regulator [Oscillospiraceae bacterium]
MAEEKCACSGAYLDKFIQPSVLVVLSEGPAHGFRLMTELRRRELVSYAGFDATGFYRTLKKMEQAGLVRGEAHAFNGKVRRVFSITEEGRRCLVNWYMTLCAYRSNVSHIVRCIEQTLDRQ